MLLKKLSIQHFRNIDTILLTPCKGINVIYGNNAAGKTSILEAIYYLSHLRSFRSQFSTDLIQREQPFLQLSADLYSDMHTVPLGIRRSRRKAQVRMNREPVRRVSDITAKFPVLAIHPDSYKLITGSSSQRRQYLDWGVFHVEHGFLLAWKRYKQAVSQRNAALKARHSVQLCQLWNREICEAASHIDRLRHHYFSSLTPHFQKLAAMFFGNDEVTLEYRRGWPADCDLSDLLRTNLDRERLKGYTLQGPHRADIILRVNGQSAQSCISRGQQKTLVALLRLAQASHFTELKKLPCVLLYDDLPAELDTSHRAMILEVLSDMNVQLFTTAIDKQHIPLSNWSDTAMFHVEHGSISEIQSVVDAS
jgi:DNA replication and repair protein RecF